MPQTSEASDPDDSGSDPLPAPAAPALLTVALGVVLLEAGALAAAGLLFVVQVVTGATGSRAGAGVAVFLVLFTLGVAWALIAAARALRRGRRGGRGPVVTWQLLQGATALTILPAAGPGVVVVAWAALVAAAAVVVLLLAGPVVRFLAR